MKKNLNSLEEFSNDTCSTSVELLRAIEQYDLVHIQELLPSMTCDLINAPFGPLQITVLQFASFLPLDKAITLVKLLISFGANVKNKDKLGRTALHYAASNGSLELVEILIKNGAIVDSKYELNSLSRNANASKDYGISKLLPLPECWGRTPLHQAVKGNHKDIVGLLLKNGADANIEDDHGNTPILLAGAGIQTNNLSEYEAIIDLLILHEANVNVHSSNTGTTPLHHAVSLNSYLAVESLLKAGAILKDGPCGQTPIHEAAGRGYDNILSLLLQYEIFSINRPDTYGRTALHKAAYAGSRECVKLLINHGGDLSAETKSNKTVMDIIFLHIPRPLHLLNEVLNSKITSNNLSINDVNFKITLDFKMLAPKGADRQMSVIEALLSTGNDKSNLELLQHPLIESFLYLKWARLRIFFILLVAIHILFVISLSTYILLIVHYNSAWEFAIAFARNILLLSALTLFTHAFIQCLLVPRHYFRKYEMWLNLICAFFSFIVAIVGENTSKLNITNTNTTNVDGKIDENIFPASWVLHTASIVVLLAWIELMLLIGRFPSYGYYALMFSAVLQNVVKVLLTFVCLVIGFALSFSVQFHTYEQFKDPWRALVKTTVMMMGEFEYADLFADSKENEIPIRLPATSRVIFLLFIILSSIVLMNLMVGLAVNDIQGLQREGHVKRLAKQATFLAHLEKVLAHKLLKSDWFPNDFYKLLYSRRFLNTILVLKPGERNKNLVIENNNKWMQISLALLEPIIDVALHNTAYSCLAEDAFDYYKTISKDILLALKGLQDEVRNIKEKLATITDNQIQ